MKESVARRFDNADLAEDRFVSVKDGEKMCVDHDTRYTDPRDVPGENYGIYANEDDQLVVLDVDNHREGAEDISPVALSALDALPETLKMQSPHVPEDDTGGHRLFKVDGDETPAELFERRFGKKNPIASWGEIIAKNKYVVGAGSQLDGCTKDWCDECATEEGGVYGIKADREIATVDPDTLAEALAADPDLGETAANNSLDDYESGGGGDDSRDRPTPDAEDNDDVDVDDYEKLPRSTVEAMLEELPGNQHFDEWIRTGYAVYDWDGSSTGKEVFEEWSRTNPKWEQQESQRQIDYIWSEGESGDSAANASVGTLVHLAREHGYVFESAPSYDEDEVSRADELLASECSRTEPAGKMVHRNGQYGYMEKEERDDGTLIEVFDPVTNFTLETLEHLKTEDSELLKIRVHPAHPMEDEYEVDVHPTVFNDARSFKEEIVRGRTTRYEPGKRTQMALNDLRETAGSQMVPTRTGVEHIGLAGETYDEWVSPAGTMTEDGPAEDPDFRYYAKGGASDSDGGALARKWQLDPETVGDYDADDVARMVELLPKTRRHDRGLPILGWFYAAPLRPLVHDWEGEFNLLQVVGSTGTGKTSTLKTYWEAFGMRPDPFSASDTPFTLMKHMSSSRGVPVWIDEYKPADIRNDRLDTLHRRLREVTKGTAVSKGKQNLGELLFHIEAPVVVSGEQKFSRSAPAVRRRAIMTTLSSEPTQDGTSYTRAFSELTGTAYEDPSGSVHYPNGYDLSEHARAYYQFILGQDPDRLEELWNECREDTGDLLAAREVTLEPTEFQGAQTILFGVRLFRRFAEVVGADRAKLPTDDDVADAFEHFASNIGKDGKRRGYDDSFLELFAQAASAEYITPDADFRFVDSQKFGDEVLAMHMPSVYAGVKRYVRDYNLGDEYNIIGKTDYLSSFRDQKGTDSHILEVNHAVRLEGGRTKCLVIHPERTRQRLGSDFDLRAFGVDPEDETADGEGGDDSDDDPSPPDPMPVGEIEPSTQDRASVIATVEFGEYDGRNASNDSAPAWTATLKDDTGEAELVVWDDEDVPDLYNAQGVFEPDAVLVKDASVSAYDDTTQLVVEDPTAVTKAQVGAGHTSAEDETGGEGAEQAAETDDSGADSEQPAATDGGGPPEDAEGATADVHRLVGQLVDEGADAPEDAVSIPELGATNLGNKERQRKLLKKAAEQRQVAKTDGKWYALD